MRSDRADGGVVQAVSRAHRGDACAQWCAEQRQIADQIKRLMTRELIGAAKPARVHRRPVVAEDHAVVEVGPESATHRPQRLGLRKIAERASIGQRATAGRRVAGPSLDTKPSEVDVDPKVECRGRRDDDLASEALDVNRPLDPPRLDDSFEPSASHRIAPRPGAPVEDGNLPAIDFDASVGDAAERQCCEQMLDRRNAPAAAIELGCETPVRHSIDHGVCAVDHQADPRLGRFDSRRAGTATMESTPDELDRRTERSSPAHGPPGGGWSRTAAPGNMIALHAPEPRLRRLPKPAMPSFLARGLRRLGFVAVIAGCASGGGSAPLLEADATIAEAPDAAAGPLCDPNARRATTAGPFSCLDEPVFVTIDDGDHRYDIFTYEASHPLATVDAAFPCADERDVSYRAPAGIAEACAVVGVLPWHTITWGDADAACSAAGWRLCTGDEMLRACGGESGYAYTWGPTFDSKKCNLRGVFAAEGEELASGAPTGEFPECHSSDGVYDLTGNLWEWTSDVDDTRPGVYHRQGAGWRIIAQQHHDGDLVCSKVVPTVGATGSSFANDDLGFRCCRDTP